VFVRPWWALTFGAPHVIPDLSFLWVIFFVLLITTLLNILLFKPLIAVMRQREGAVTSARTLAESAAARAQQAADELESRTKAARADVYQQMDASRRAAEDGRAQLLAAAREQAAASTSASTAQIATETAEARDRIERDAEVIASAIATRVLGRQTT
jgi:F-type H+-transporting ATPase subunit b